MNALAALNTGNGNTGPTWAVALFVVAWLALVAVMITLYLKRRKK